MQLADALDNFEWGRTLPTIVAAVEADAVPRVRDRRLIDERRTAVAEIIGHGIREGELAASLPIDDVIDAFVRRGLSPSTAGGSSVGSRW